MNIELNQVTFRRLVQLYLLSIVASIGAFIVEYIVWFDFIDAFDRLSIEHFGEPSDLQLISFGGFLLIACIAHIVAAFGLLKFKPWSKSLIWISLLLMLPMAFVPSFEFGWYGPLSMWIQLIGTALLGAIILLAYSREHGALWFSKPQVSEDRNK